VVIGDILGEGPDDAATRPAVFVAVEDSGPGVTPSERARIFERFARGSAGRSRAGGTGLGLALVAEHVRAHGGHTWVEDSPSGGARFVVTFPKGES
jgi:signal transduction histidine kinase